MGGAIKAVVGVVTTAAGLITGNPFLIKTGLALTLSGASQLLAPKPKALGQDISFSERHQKRIQTIRSPTAPRQVIYGETVVSGPLVAVFSSGSDNKYLHMFICLAGHECESIGDVWLNDKLSTDAKFSGLVRIKKHLGTAAQTADTDAVSEITEWTTNHRLRGICYLYVRLTWDQDVWISGIPNIKAKTKGKKIYDPRTSTTAWSDNPILCERDYLLNEFKADSSAMDETVGNANANVCDELVPILPSGTQKRYLCNGSFTTDMKPIDIMEELRSSCAGINFRQQGKYKLNAGAFTTPTITLTESDLRDDMQLQTKDSRKDLFNAIKGEFVDPDDFYMPTSFPPLINSTFETEDGGMRIFKDIELAFTTNNKTAQRISKIHLMRGRQGVKVFFPAKMTAFELAAWDTVYLTISRLNWSAKSFRILKWSMSIDGGIDLELQEDVAADWSWNSSEEQSIAAPPDMPVPDPGTVAAPANLTITSGTAELIQKADGSVLSRLKAAWDVSTDEMVLDGGFYEIQIKKSADIQWYFATIVLGDQTFGYVVTVEDNVNYDVRVRAQNKQGVSGAWSTVTGHNVAGKSAAPSDVTDFSIVQIGDRLLATWTTISDVDRSEYEIRRGSSWAQSVFMARTRKAFQEISDWIEGSNTYLIKAIDTTGNESTNATTFTTSLDVPNERASVQSFDELVGLGGVFDGLVERDLGGGQKGIALEPLQTWDNSGDTWDAGSGVTNWDGNTVLTGTYVTEVINIGSISYARILADIGLDDSDGATLKIEESNSDDGISYTAWRLIGPGDQKWRYAKLRITLSASDPTDDPVINKFNIIVDGLVRSIRGTDIAVPTGAGTVVTFAVPFIQTPNIQVTERDAADDVYIISASNTGFTLKHDGAGTAQIDYVAQGV